MELLEFLQGKPALLSAPEQELVLRSMVETKIKDLNKPRSEVLPLGKAVPKRIQNLVNDNEKFARAKKNDTKAKY